MCWVGIRGFVGTPVLLPLRAVCSCLQLREAGSHVGCAIIRLRAAELHDRDKQLCPRARLTAVHSRSPLPDIVAARRFGHINVVAVSHVVARHVLGARHIRFRSAPQAKFGHCCLKAATNDKGGILWWPC